jgi:dolichol-phosphate mannosyltransferase
MVAWVGYAQMAIPYERAARVASKSKYPLHKILAFAWTAATSFSILPLRIIMTFPLVVMLFGVEEAERLISAYIFYWYTVRGWTELIVVISVLGGTMLMSIGMLGEYIGKIYEQSKDRPLYLVARTRSVESPKHAPASEPLSRSEYR